MKDTQAPRFRPLTLGVDFVPIGAVSDHDGGIPLDQGVVRGVQTVSGVPCGPITSAKVVGAPLCSATTKKGNPCKAYAGKTTTLCVGHSQ